MEPTPLSNFRTVSSVPQTPHTFAFSPLCYLSLAFQFLTSTLLTLGSPLWVFPMIDHQGVISVWGKLQFYWFKLIQGKFGMDENHPPFWLCVLRFCSSSRGVGGHLWSPVSPLSCPGRSLGQATELCVSVTVSVGIETRIDQWLLNRAVTHRETLPPVQLTV